MRAQYCGRRRRETLLPYISLSWVTHSALLLLLCCHSFGRRILVNPFTMTLGLLNLNFNLVDARWYDMIWSPLFAPSLYSLLKGKKAVQNLFELMFSLFQRVFHYQCALIKSCSRLCHLFFSPSSSWISVLFPHTLATHFCLSLLAN